MWPFKMKSNETSEKPQENMVKQDVTVACGIEWRQILSEGKSVELFDGCRAKCDGTMENL